MPQGQNVTRTKCMGRGVLEQNDGEFGGRECMSSTKTVIKAIFRKKEDPYYAEIYFLTKNAMNAIFGEIGFTTLFKNNF